MRRVRVAASEGDGDMAGLSQDDVALARKAIQTRGWKRRHQEYSIVAYASQATTRPCYSSGALPRKEKG